MLSLLRRLARVPLRAARAGVAALAVLACAGPEPPTAQTEAAPPQPLSPAHASAPVLELRPGDHVCLVGNGLAERLQHDGWLDARLHARFPEHDLVLRNLGFAADELTVQQRTEGFGTPDEFLTQLRADVVLAFWGFNESFAGQAGLPAFREDLRAWIAHVRRQRYDAARPDEAPRLVLFTPNAFENHRDPHLPDGSAQNVQLEPYAEAMLEVAREAGVPCVDLFAPTLALYARERVAGLHEAGRGPLTIDGIHLGSRGNAALAELIEAALFPPAPGAPTATEDSTTAADSAPAAGSSAFERLAWIRAAVVERNAAWFHRYRATDGYNIYGGRSSLTYDGVTNRDVLMREMEVLEVTAERLDRAVWAAARGLPAAGNAAETLPALPPQIPVATNKPGDGPGGSYVFRDGEAAIAAMTPAPGLEVRLFADEAQFPELANPVQMSFDTRGRLWVAAWPTYPHWQPGQPMNDKLLILEDTDGDGRADSCTAFADDLHDPTGFEFWNGGVLVAQAPDLVFLQDTDGDDRADVRERLLGGLNSADTHHTANSFVIGPDGALYFQEGVFHQTQIESIYGPVRNHDACVWRYEPRTRRVERYAAYGFLNPHGHVFDRWGQDFFNDGTTNENFFALPLTGFLPEPQKHGATGTFFPQRSRPAAATEILSSSLFPAENQGNYLIANVIGFQGIFQYELHDDGSGFSATEVDPLVQSTDPNFRPVDIEVGPDGAVWFLDWQAPLIGHMQHHIRDPNRDHNHGRVYRVLPAGATIAPPVSIAGRPIPELLELLKSSDDRVRYRARLELSGRNSADVATSATLWAFFLEAGAPPDMAADAAVTTEMDAARHVTSGEALEHALLEALWLQAQHGVLDRPLLERLLASPEPRARAAAVRALRHLRHEFLAPPLALLRAAAVDPDPRVRLEAVVACSFFPVPEAAEIALLSLQAPTDRFLDYALDETLLALTPQWRAALVGGEAFAADNPAGLALLLARLDTDELAGVRPGEALDVELLARHGLPAGEYARAATDLAARRGTTAGTELLAAIDRADARTSGHIDHLLSGLFASLGALPEAERASLAAPLRALSTDGRRPSTRRLAIVARLRTDGSIESAWAEASRSLGGLGDLLDALPLLDPGRDRALAEALFPRVLPLLDGPPAGLATGDAARPGTSGRYVRVELPGPARTLTLAEVEVFSGGENVARRGSATQSSVAWSGDAARAIDGNTSGAFGDGGQTHTIEDQPNAWWELDLGSEQALDRLVLWNRGEAGGRYVGRLDGAQVRVLDAARRTTFETVIEHAPVESVTFDLGSPTLRVRRAAALALPALGATQHAGEAQAALVARFDDVALRPALVQALDAVPPERWNAVAAQSLGAILLEVFAAAPAAEFETDAGRQLLALADGLQPVLATHGSAGVFADGSDLAARLRAATRRLGPQVVTLRPVPDSLSWDRREFTVVAARPVELRFENVDIMPHNLVVTAPGALALVGLAGERMAADANAWTLGYVPVLPEVLHASRLLNPGETQVLAFRAPEQPGDYPYVCTFPGHWIRMNGVMHVMSEESDAVTGAGAGPADSPAPPAAPARAFVKLWTAEELLPQIGAASHGSPEHGRAVFEAASCVRCHAVDGVGGRTGPELRGVVGKHDDAALLLQILEPSREIAPELAARVFITTDGRVVAGRVLREDDETVALQDNPYSETPLLLPVATIAERRTSEISVMPEGLLSTFTREEILDLIAYLGSLRPPAGS